MGTTLQQSEGEKAYVSSESVRLRLRWGSKEPCRRGKKGFPATRSPLGLLIEWYVAL